MLVMILYVAQDRKKIFEKKCVVVFDLTTGYFDGAVLVELYDMDVYELYGVI